MGEIIEFKDGTPGSIINADDAWYFADRDYLTNSMLSELEKSPLHLKQYLDGIKAPQSAAYAWGSAFHCIVLEPDDFNDRFFVFDDAHKCQELIDGGSKSPRSTKKYKEWKEIMMEQVGDRQIISQEDYDVQHYLRDKIFKIPELAEMLNACAKEKILVDEYDGVQRKVKADAISYGNFLIDLKTTADPVSKFGKSFRNYNYDRQMAWYKDVCKVNNVYMIAVEKSSPNTVGFFEVTEESIELGREKYLYLLNQFQEQFQRGGIKNFDQYYLRSFI